MNPNITIAFYGIIPNEIEKSLYMVYSKIKPILDYHENSKIIGVIEKGQNKEVIEAIFKGITLYEFDKDCIDAQTFLYKRVDLNQVYTASSLKALITNLNSTYNEQPLILINWSDKPFLTPTWDSSLPSEYIYLPYTKHIDEKYNFSWMYSNQKNLYFLKDFYDYLLNTCKNGGKVQSFIDREEWPMAIPSPNLFKSTIKKLNRFIFRTIYNFANFIKPIVPYSFNSKLIGLTQKSYKYMTTPSITGENSTYMNQVLCFKLSPELITYSHIFKIFLFESNKRKDIKFLLDDDFKNYGEH